MIVGDFDPPYSQNVSLMSTWRGQKLTENSTSACRFSLRKNFGKQVNPVFRWETAVQIKYPSLTDSVLLELVATNPHLYINCLIFKKKQLHSIRELKPLMSTGTLKISEVPFADLDEVYILSHIFGGLYSKKTVLIFKILYLFLSIANINQQYFPWCNLFCLSSDSDFRDNLFVQQKWPAGQTFTKQLTE